jgi:hypothetical protein
MTEHKTVQEILTAIVNGWPGLVVRVKQDGVMDFMPLAQVRDQRLVYKIVKDLLKRMIKEAAI